MSSFLFVVWIASGAVQMQGVTSGSLGSNLGSGGGEEATARRACAMLAKRRETNKDARLWKIGGETLSVCDWGCETEVSAYPVECATVTEPAREKTVVR